MNNANKKVIKKNCAFNVASTLVEESVKVKKIVAARLSIDFIYYYLIKWHSICWFGLPYHHQGRTLLNINDDNELPSSSTPSTSPSPSPSIFSSIE